MPVLATWLPWALLSAVFAALTAIFAKVGLEGIDSDYATLLRTVVIVLTLGALIHATGKWQSPWDLPSKSVAFLVLSPPWPPARPGCATSGRSSLARHRRSRRWTS
jgi:transporter family protein